MSSTFFLGPTWHPSCCTTVPEFHFPTAPFSVLCCPCILLYRSIHYLSLAIGYSRRPRPSRNRLCMRMAGHPPLRCVSLRSVIPSPPMKPLHGLSAIHGDILISTKIVDAQRSRKRLLGMPFDLTDHQHTGFGRYSDWTGFADLATNYLRLWVDL